MTKRTSAPKLFLSQHQTHCLVFEHKYCTWSLNSAQKIPEVKSFAFSNQRIGAWSCTPIVYRMNCMALTLCTLRLLFGRMLLALGSKFTLSLWTFNIYCLEGLIHGIQE